MQPTLTAKEYLSSGHFISATFENWESEFLQMSMYVLLTVWLRRRVQPNRKIRREEGAGEEEVDGNRNQSPMRL